MAMLFLTSSFMLFRWEPAEWVQMLQTRVWWWWVTSKKIGIGIFVYKQRLLSIQKVVQHVQTFRIFFTTQAFGPVTGEFIELVPS